jgi:hypothetical protein
MTTRLALLLLITAGVLIAGGVIADRAGRADPVGRLAPAPHDPTAWSPVVYPLQRLPVIFSHARHLARGTACAACHPAAATSRSALDNLLPTEIECRACHAIDRDKPDPAIAGAPPVACKACHPGYTTASVIQRVYLTPSPLKFDHKAHRGAPCERCHGDLRKVDLATTEHLPTMASCLGCHTAGATERHCADCHLASRGGLLQTQFEHGTLIPAHDGLGDAHGPDFKTHHTQEARQVGATCGACHDESECLACHQGVVKPMEFHPGNYLLTHAVDARRGKPDCGACHRAQTFCIACHEREGLGMRGDSQFSAIDPARAFHPAGWASPLGGPNLHAREASRSITTCTSCHRETDCIKCHSAQPGAGHVSPHPRAWRASAQCKAMDRGNRRMCLRCHIAKDELGCDWAAKPATGSSAAQ